MASSGVVEDHMAEKSKQMRSVVSNIESSVLDSFSKLTSNAEKQRISAGIRIVSYLYKKEAESENDGICMETRYAINRLIRGLASPKIYSKAGFFSTLVGLLSAFDQVKLPDVFAAIEKELKPGSNKTKGEIGEIYSGRVLAYGSLIESGLFLKGNSEEQSDIIQKLIEAGNKKSYLSLRAATFIIKILRNISETLFHDVVWPALKNEVCKNWENQSLETFYILLVSSSLFPKVVKVKLLAKHLGTHGIFVEDSVELCCKLLMGQTTYGMVKHPVYEEFCKQLSESEHLALFWENGIDVYLSKGSKMTLAVSMLICILKNLKEPFVIPQLLTSNFMMSIIKSFSGKKMEKSFTEKLKQLISFIIKALENSTDKCRIAVIKKFLFYPGDLFFEKKSGTKAVQLIAKQLSTDGVKKLVKVYRHIVSCSSTRKTGPNETDHLPWTDSERLYAAQMLTRLLGHPAVITEVEWKVKQLQFFINMGLFNTTSNECEPTVRPFLAAGVKGCFFKALDHRLPKLDDLRSLFSRIMIYINGQMFNSEEPVALRDPFTEKSLQAWKEMTKVVEQLERKAGDGSNSSKEQKASVIPVFHTMFLQMGLQLFVNPSMAEEALQELHSCLAHVPTGARRSKKLKESQMENDEPHWVEVAVDLLLSLLSHNSHLLRSLAGCVFPHLCPHLSPTALHQILDVLDPTSGENPLSNPGDATSSEDDSEDENSTVNSDSDKTKETTSTDISGSDIESEVSDSEDIFADQTEEDEEMKVNDKVRMAVQQALGSSALLTDTESVDLDEMDEEEGKRLDAALSQAFSLMKQNNSKQSKKQSRDDRSLTHFRIRVIDLLEVYLATYPDMALCIDMILPLFQLLEFCIHDSHQRPLELRIGGCLKKLSNIKKFSNVSGVTQKLLAETLSQLLDKGERKAAVYIDMSAQVTSCCIFLLRCSEYLKDADSEKSPSEIKKLKKDSLQFIDIYRSALDKFFKKRDCLLPVNLFDSLLKILWNGNWALLPTLASAAFDSEVRPFRRSQALDLMMVFYRNHRLLLGASEKNKKMMANVEHELSRNTIQLLTQLSSPQHSKCAAVEKGADLLIRGVKQKFVCELLRLLLLTKQTYSRSEAESSIDWQGISSALLLYKESAEMSTDTKTAFNRLCSNLGISPKQINKQKEENLKVDAEEEGTVSPDPGYKSQDESDISSEIIPENLNKYDDDDGNSMKQTKNREKKRRKHSRSKDELKKKSKQLRLNAVSEGMESITFSGVDIIGVQMDDLEIKDTKKEIVNGTVGELELSNSVVSKTSKRKQKVNDTIESVFHKKKKIDTSQV